MSTYKIVAIKPNGTVDVTFSIDKKTQNIDALPVTDADALIAALDAYAVAYEAGLAQQAADVAPAVVPAEVAALIGKDQVVEVPVA